MRFSIVIPVYNVEAYLGHCLDSVLNQTFQDFEVILVNDGSTDQSPMICENFVNHGDCKSQLINQGNSGLLSARRAGISAARGDYIISLDSDDALRTDALELINDCIEETHSDVVVYGCSREKDYSHAMLPTLTPGRVYNKSEAQREFCKTNRLNSMCSKAVSRSVVGQCVDFSRYGRLNMGEDGLQSLTIFDNASSVTCLNESLYYYRPNASSISSRVGIEYLEDMDIVHCEMLDYAERWDREAVCDGCFTSAISRCMEEIVHFALHYPVDMSFDAARAGLRAAANSRAVFSYKTNEHAGNLPVYAKLIAFALKNEKLWFVWFLAQVRNRMASCGGE